MQPNAVSVVPGALTPQELLEASRWTWTESRCPILNSKCSKRFPCQAMLEKHLKLHIKDTKRPLGGLQACEWKGCKKSFRSRRELRTHLTEEHINAMEILCPVQDCFNRSPDLESYHDHCIVEHYHNVPPNLLRASLAHNVQPEAPQQPLPTAPTPAYLMYGCARGFRPVDLSQLAASQRDLPGTEFLSSSADEDENEDEDKKKDKTHRELPRVPRLWKKPSRPIPGRRASPSARSTHAGDSSRSTSRAHSMVSISTELPSATTSSETPSQKDYLPMLSFAHFGQESLLDPVPAEGFNPLSAFLPLAQRPSPIIIPINLEVLLRTFMPKSPKKEVEGVNAMDIDTEPRRIPRVDKGKGKAIEPPIPPSPVASPSSVRLVKTTARKSGNSRAQTRAIPPSEDSSRSTTDVDGNGRLRVNASAGPSTSREDDSGGADVNRQQPDAMDVDSDDRAKVDASTTTLLPHGSFASEAANSGFIFVAPKTPSIPQPLSAASVGPSSIARAPSLSSHSNSDSSADPAPPRKQVRSRNKRQRVVLSDEEDATWTPPDDVPRQHADAMDVDSGDEARVKASTNDSPVVLSSRRNLGLQVENNPRDLAAPKLTSRPGPPPTTPITVRPPLLSLAVSSSSSSRPSNSIASVPKPIPTSRASLPLTSSSTRPSNPRPSLSAFRPVASTPVAPSASKLSISSTRPLKSTNTGFIPLNTFSLQQLPDLNTVSGSSLTASTTPKLNPNLNPKLKVIGPKISQTQASVSGSKPMTVSKPDPNSHLFVKHRKPFTVPQPSTASNSQPNTVVYDTPKINPNLNPSPKPRTLNIIRTTSSSSLKPKADVPGLTTGDITRKPKTIARKSTAGRASSLSKGSTPDTNGRTGTSSANDASRASRVSGMNGANGTSNVKSKGGESPHDV